MAGVKRTTIIPKAPVARILINAGAKRVSADAVDEMVDILTTISEKLSEQALKIAKHSGRKTINEGDVRLAAKQ